MASVQLFPPDADDVNYIADNLRISDAQELRAVHGDNVDLNHCLQMAVAASEEAHVAYTAYGEPIAVFGVAPVSLLGGEGCPWMLGTNELEAHGRDVVELSRLKVAEWNRRYNMLFNYVDARNTRSINWLRRTGFNIFAPEPFGVKGLPFRRFERCA